MTKAELENQIIKLKSTVKYLEKQLELKEKEISRLKNRNAGRTPKFSDREKNNMISEYKAGKTIREVATQNHCSVGYVHKLISEQDNFT